MIDDEANAFLTRWWNEVWHEGKLDVVDELLAEPFVQHSTRGSLTLTRKQVKERLVQVQRVLHRPKTTVDDLAIVGDKVWLRATSTGVNLETHGPACVTWMACFRLHDGRVAEAWLAPVPKVDWR